MKALRRMFVVATLAVAGTMVAAPAYAEEKTPPDVTVVDAETHSSPTCVSSNSEGERAGGGSALGAIAAALGVTEILNLDNVLNCNSILSDLHVLSNHG